MFIWKRDFVSSKIHTFQVKSYASNFKLMFQVQSNVSKLIAIFQLDIYCEVYNYRPLSYRLLPTVHFQKLKKLWKV